MHPASRIAAPSQPRAIRRLILGGALLLALTIAVAPRSGGVHAQDARPAAPAAAPAAPKAPTNPGVSATVKDGEGGSATIDIRVDKGKKSVTIQNSGTGKPGAEDVVDEDADSSGPLVGVGPGKKGHRVRVGVFGDDREYDSFNDFVHTEPGLAAMVMFIVAIVFLSPVLAIGLFLWYRWRKARMLNETMLKLAEKGVVPPAEALGALTGNPSSAIAAAPSAAPLYEQAKQVRRRAAWSDLRKGVILGGIGLGLTSFSMLDDGTPNSIGLVLLFVGIGYIVLWWFEDRQNFPKGSGASASPPAPPSGGTDGVA
jgi:Domain of unknown function (DUF6249)